MCTTSTAAAYLCAHCAQVVITWVVMSAVVLSYDGACIVLCSPSLQPSAFKGTLNGPYLVAMMMQQYPPSRVGPPACQSLPPKLSLRPLCGVLLIAVVFQSCHLHMSWVVCSPALKYTCMAASPS